VRLHAGDMDISSRLGEGTCVTVRLPINGGGRRPADPVKLPTERAGEPAADTKIRMKKSA
jgi:hypothetical protein